MKTSFYMVAWFVPLLLSAVLGADVHAQQRSAPALDPAKALTQYIHRVWHADDGLPQNSVGGIVQTRDGYLWLGTEEGLVRFDGIRFTVFDPSNTPAFEGSQIIHALAEDAAGALWIGTQGGGLIRYAHGTFRRFGAAEGFTGAWVGALLPDASGRLWIGTRDAGLFAYHAGSFAQYTTDDGLASNRISALAHDPDGALWIGTEAGLNRLDDGFISTYRHPSGDDFILALHRARDGTLWAGTHQGLSRLRAERLERFTPRSGADALGGVWTFLEDAAGSLWLGMANGLGRLRDGHLEHFSMKDGLSHDRILALFSDREGSLWIGTEGGGLNQLWDGKFSVLTTREGLSLDVILSLFEDADGVLWAGTQGGGLNRLDSTGVTAYTTADGLPSDLVASVYGTPDGALWVGTLEGGLARLKDGRLTTFTTRDGLPSDDIYALFAAPDGALWIGTDAGVARYAPDATGPAPRFTAFSAEDGLGSDLVTTLLETHDGALWIGTYDGGLTRYADGQFTVFTTDDGLGSNTVTALHEDAEGQLWVGTYGGGLSLFTSNAPTPAQSFTTLTSREGLFNDNIYAILEDAAGLFWMSCNKGLFSARKTELNGFMAGRAGHVTTTPYGKDDGLKSPEMNGGTSPSAWQRRDGSLWFPSLKGIVGIDPQQIRHNRTAPLVTIEEIRVDNVPLAAGAPVELAPGKKKIDFKFTAFSFVAPETIRFRYILEGYDTAWQERTDGRTATYTNLSPGVYTFRVLARNNDGVWNEAGASIRFTLKPFFYQTFWFYTLCLAGLVLLVGGGYHFRVRQLRHRERELQTLVEIRTEDLRTAKEKIEAQARTLQELDRFKTRFFANVSHEFRTPLTMIVGPLENALDGSYGPLDGPVRRQLEIMLRNAMRLMRLINQLLDLSKLEAGKMALKARPRNLVPFLEGVVFSFTAFAEQKGLTLNFQAGPRDVHVYFEPDKLEKVFFNLLSNAVKFTPGDGEIDVMLSVEEASETMPQGSVAVHVRDTGAGIPEADLPHIFDRFRQVDGSNTREYEGTGIGLALVKELVLLHHGTIDVESTLGEGTEFVIRLPLGDAHLQPTERSGSDRPDDALEPEDSAMAELAFAQQFMPEAPPDAPLAEAPADAPLILLVEDNADVRAYVAAILGTHYRIATATNGVDGLAQARALEPDLIISDVMMPRMDGNAMCRALKADPATCHLPVVLLTARATQQMRIEGLEVGADDYLAKPFNARELLARTRNLIQLRQQERALKKLNTSLEEKVEQQVQLILEERRHYETQLIQAKDQAEASLRLKTAILDNMNHEFRTPLTAIQGYAQILEKEVQTELREFASHIDQSGERLMRTLDAVHQLSLLQADNYELNPEMTDVVELARRATQHFAAQAEMKGLALKLDAPAAPLTILLDRAALERILTYLLDNAIKFTDDGEVTLVVTPKPGGARLSLRDTGQGIDADFLPVLFDAFTQESSGLTRDHHGMGVSLTVAHHLTRLMGGSLTVSSEKGRGSLFTLHFPAPPAVPTPRRAGSSLNALPDASS